MSKEILPISEGFTVYKTEKGWSAVALVESFGRKQIVSMDEER